MRQRVVIAIALACDPRVLIADEPTTALDVTIQAQILELMRELQDRLGMSIILITHDLGVVASTAHRIGVMYGGRIVETGTVREIFYNPQMPYTWGLLASIPLPNADSSLELIPIPGTPPDATDPPKGCPFTSRCPYAMKVCGDEMPSPRRSRPSTGPRAGCTTRWPRRSSRPPGWGVRGDGDERLRRRFGRRLANGRALLEVRDLRKHFQIGRGTAIKAVDGISLEIKKGETFGLVGESGCGKVHGRQDAGAGSTSPSGRPGRLRAARTSTRAEGRGGQEPEPEECRWSSRTPRPP
jgi:oligopeptide/dipeptide ABC transporter ATP-binding protein